MFTSRLFNFTSILFLCASGALAGNQHQASRRSSQHDSHNLHRQIYSDHNPALVTRQSRNFTLIENYQGKTFFDNWNFMTFDDPTHGNVRYVNRDEAFNLGLAYVRDDDVVVMKVDDTTVLNEGQNRNSVRIHTKKSWTKGLFIADILQMPYGCSVWPAFWSNGPNWPTFGEIDVIEGVHNVTNNHMTLHTLPGCTLDASKADPNVERKVTDRTFIGEVRTTNCDANVDFNTGCGIKDNSQTSYGFGLNSNGGGVWATLWDDDGIRIWYFQRGFVPEDIESQTPNPDSWPAPQAFFSTDSCDMNQFFRDHEFIFNITLCGDLGNATFNQFGCSGTCAATVADPSNFRTAKWKVNYFRVYNNQ